MLGILKRLIWLIALGFLVVSDAKAQANIDYDARQFLSVVERNTFRLTYPEFDQRRVEKKWEWRDVDPLGLFSPEENRRRRRELFVFEYSALVAPKEQPATDEQLAFSAALKKQLENPLILIGRESAKIVTPYTSRYEGALPNRNLLQRTAQLGLQWAQVGGANLYIYNGPILLARYKSGYVSLGNRNIDQPRKRRTY